MRGSRKYVIPVKGLKTGKHTYTFDIDNEFFESLKRSEIRDASFIVEVELNKETRIMELTAHFKGSVEVLCDRCLEYFKLTRDFHERAVVTFSRNKGTENDDFLIIPENDHELDLTHYFYESIMLNMPYQYIHPTDKEGNSLCNQEMIKRLNTYSAKNKNDQQQGETDPRWHQLKEIRFKK